jgi:transcriptional regulator of acetoin/glycerol metabolism
MSGAWGPFLKARLALIHEWYKEGIPGHSGRATPEMISRELNQHDQGQIRLLLATPVEPEPTRVDEVLRRHCLNVYRDNGSNVSKTCKALGVGRTTLYRWFQKWEIKAK